MFEFILSNSPITVSHKRNIHGIFGFEVHDLFNAQGYDVERLWVHSVEGLWR